MSGEPELWAARDKKGSLNIFNGEPSLGIERKMFIGNTWCDYLTELNSDMLPDLAPGEKCRVRIERCE